MVAAGEGNLAVRDILLAAGADVEIRDCQGYTALDRSAAHGHVGILQAILACEDDINAADDTVARFALHVAAEHGLVGSIGALIEGGADIELKSSSGVPPLGFAAYHTQSKAMHTLLRRGENARVRQNNGDTLLHVVCRAQRAGVDRAVDLLLRSGVEETAVNADGKTPARLLKSTAFRWERRCSPQELERAASCEGSKRPGIAPTILAGDAPLLRSSGRGCWMRRQRR